MSLTGCLLVFAFVKTLSAAPQLLAVVGQLPPVAADGNAQATSSQPLPHSSTPIPTPASSAPPPPPSSQAPVINVVNPAPAQPQPSVNPVIAILNSGSRGNESEVAPAAVAASSLNETTEEPPRNFTFEEMLGPDFLHAMNRTTMPEPEVFRKRFGPPMNSSGKFHLCTVHADCFQYREPAEWCRTKNFIQWKDKSCFCTTDTMVRSCIVERTDGDKTEWTFCSDFADLKCI